MKFFSLGILLSTQLLAGTRMCPVRTYEVISCRTDNIQAISICEKKDGKLLLGHLENFNEEVQMLPVIESEDQEAYTFHHENFKFIVKKGIDDHTVGVLRPTISMESPIQFRCLTRDRD